MNKLFSYLNTPLRKLYFVIVLLLLLMWFFVQVLSIFDASDNQAPQSTDETIIQDQTQYPEVSAFINNYFDQIQRGNYDILVQNYWESAVESEIKRACEDPLAEEQKSNEYLWQKCAYFRDIDVNTVSISEVEGGYEAIIQFIGKDGKIVGVDVHPEYRQGHILKIKNTTDGLRTSDWQFITL